MEYTTTINITLQIFPVNYTSPIGFVNGGIFFYTNIPFKLY